MPDLEERLELMDKKMKRVAETLYDKYRDQMDLMEKESLLAKVKKGLSPYDVYALGKQLESFDQYLLMCEEDGNLGQLGKIPQIAYDVITVAYGTSIIPFIASVQPIEEESGMVYFKQVRAATTKGTFTADASVLIDPRTGQVTPGGPRGPYASNFVQGEFEGGSATLSSGSLGPYTLTLQQTPARPQTIKVYVNGYATTLFGTDDGNGNLLGLGLSGAVTYGSVLYNTIVYPTVIVNFTAAPPNGAHLLVDYQVNYEKADDIPALPHTSITPRSSLRFTP